MPALLTIELEYIAIHTKGPSFFGGNNNITVHIDYAESTKESGYAE